MCVSKNFSKSLTEPALRAGSEKILRNSWKRIHGVIRYILKKYCQSDSGLAAFVASNFSKIMQLVLLNISCERVEKDVLTMLYNCSKNTQLLQQFTSQDNIDKIISLTSKPTLTNRGLRLLTTCLHQNKALTVSSIDYNEIIKLCNSYDTLSRFTDLLHRVVENDISTNKPSIVDNVQNIINVCGLILVSELCKISHVESVSKIICNILNHYEYILLASQIDPVVSQLINIFSSLNEDTNTEMFIKFFEQVEYLNFAKVCFIAEDVRNDYILSLLETVHGSTIRLLQLLVRFCKDGGYRARVMNEHICTCIT